MGRLRAMLRSSRAPAALGAASARFRGYSAKELPVEKKIERLHGRGEEKRSDELPAMDHPPPQHRAGGPRELRREALHTGREPATLRPREARCQDLARAGGSAVE